MAAEDNAGDDDSDVVMIKVWMEMEKVMIILTMLVTMMQTLNMAVFHFCLLCAFESWLFFIFYLPAKNFGQVTHPLSLSLYLSLLIVN